MTQFIVAHQADFMSSVLDRAEPQFTKGVREEGALHAAAASMLETAVIDAWVRLRGLIERSATETRDWVKEQISELAAYVEESAKSLGRHANEFRRAIVNKIRQLITDISDALLSSMRNELRVGSGRYRLRNVTIEQKLVFSGSIEMSLTTLCEFLTNGELCVNGSYELMTD